MRPEKVRRVPASAIVKDMKNYVPPKFLNALTVLYVAGVPLSAQAYAEGSLMSNVVLVLYGAVGFFGAISTITFIGGFGLYIVRLGTEHRREGIVIMSWGVTTLFVVVILAFILKWIS